MKNDLVCQCLAPEWFVYPNLLTKECQKCGCQTDITESDFMGYGPAEDLD